MPQPISPVDPQRAALRRMQFMATALLGLSLATLVLAKGLEPRWPALAYLAAFAEAATIGGLADWYAVVALFRRPLGLPIPHTAILPANQERVAESLGEFIESNFLKEETVRRKLNEVDFAGLIVDWLADEKRAASLAGYATRMLPQMLAAADASHAKAFVAARMREAAGRVNIAPFAANLLEGLTDSGRHQQFLDELLESLRQLLLQPKSVELVLQKIREELPTLLRTLGADGFLLRKILISVVGLIEEVRQTPDHMLRREVDRLMKKLVWRLRTSEDFRARIEAFKTSLLDRPETAELVEAAWDGLRQYIEQEIRRDDSVIRQHLTEILVASARHLGADADLRADVNAGMVTALAAFIERQKSGVSRFISAQVKGWDMAHMTELVETKIGRDLQYIRFNGTLIGGLIGLTLYAVMHAFGLR